MLNDLARVLLGARRADRIRVEELSDRSGLPTVNGIVIKQAAMAAWNAVLGGSCLNNALLTFDGRTRGATTGLRRPISKRSVASCNMSAAWNASEELRAAKTIHEAKTAALNLAKATRFL